MTSLQLNKLAVISAIVLSVPASLAATNTPTTLRHHSSHTTRHKSAAATTPAPQPAPVAEATQSAGTDTAAINEPFRLQLSNLHTGESIDIVYRVGDTYIPEALAKLNYFLRDHNTQEVTHYDPKEFDLLHNLLAKLDRPGGVIDIVCGYRTPATNAALRHGSPSSGVAEHSQHMQGHAIDIRVPGVSTIALRDAALSLRAGGVGYYPIHQFVHVDVGPVRQWAFGVAPAHHHTAAGM